MAPALKGELQIAKQGVVGAGIRAHTIVIGLRAAKPSVSKILQSDAQIEPRVRHGTMSAVGGYR